MGVTSTNSIRGLVCRGNVLRLAIEHFTQRSVSSGLLSWQTERNHLPMFFRRYPLRCLFLKLLVGEKVRRERRWTTAGETPARELVRHPVAIETAAEATKLSELSM
jgi:hypothetical protein